jgi:two-component system response regulator FixJ
MVTPTRKTVVHVLDSDTSVRTSLERLLRAEGYTVRLHARARTFLEEAAAGSDACLILDVAMLEMNGLDLERELAERGIQLPTITLSCYDDDCIRHEALRLGASFFFRKPVDGKTLVDAIEWAVSAKPRAS